MYLLAVICFRTFMYTSNFNYFFPIISTSFSNIRLMLLKTLQIYTLLLRTESVHSRFDSLFSTFFSSLLRHYHINLSVRQLMKTKYISFVLLFMSNTDVKHTQCQPNFIRTHVMNMKRCECMCLGTVHHLIICIYNASHHNLISNA